MKITKYDPAHPDISDCLTIPARPIETIQRKERLCRRCRKNKITSKSNLAKYCNDCRKSDPHRHAGRKSRAGVDTIANGRKSRALPEMIVHVDTEGDGHGGIICASYGREDGTSDTIFSGDPVEIILWLMDNLDGLYTDTRGNVYRQIVGAFHFNYDTAVLTRFMDEKAGTLRLINKAKSKGGQICNWVIGKDHDGKSCGKKYHAYDRDTTINVITSGGELKEGVITYDPETHLAMAATPRRRFYAEYRPKGWDYTGYQALDVHDQGTAFIGGLERVIDTWQPELSQEQRANIAWGKLARKYGFPDVSLETLQEWEKQGRKEQNGLAENTNREKIGAYSEAECVAAARCARLLIDTISEAANIRIKANALFGSGTLASSAFREHKLATNDKTAKDDFIDWIAWLDYFGGLIETPVVGIVRGKAHEEDLNSAYPAAMVDLPCMRPGHGHWKRVKRGFRAPEAHGITEHTLGHVLMDFWYVDTPSTPPFMVRDKHGSVFQPLRGRNTWVTMPEYVAAVRQFGPASIHAKEAVFWVQTCDCPPPLAWLAELYEKRLAIKREMKQHEKGSDEWYRLNCHQEAIKLVINSCYGKLAQRRPEIGQYTNLHYASHITGSTRAKVRERTWRREKGGSIVIYQHTDSVLTVGRKPPAKDVGEKLGEWGLEDKNTIDALILQPGLMTGLKGDGKTATRGVGKSEFKKCAEWYAENRDLTLHPTTWEKMMVPIRRMISRKAAINIRHKPELAGHFYDDEMPLGPSPYKRDMDNAYQVPGQPEAWIVPPVEYIDDPATIEDIKAYQESLVFDDGEDTETIIAPRDESDYATVTDDL